VRETPEQRALRSAVRALIAAHQAQAEGDDLGLWRRISAEVGVAGLAVPERFGGAGGGPVEVSIVAEELGRALAGTPMLGSAVLATQALLASGDERACATLLPALADGRAIAALAWTTLAGHWDPAEVACRALPALSAPADAVAGASCLPKPALSAPADAAAGASCLPKTWHADDDWSIDGEAHYVLDGDVATTLLVPALTADGMGLFAVQPAQPAVTRSASISVDQTRRLAVVRLAGAVGTRIGSAPVLANTVLANTGVALSAARDAACVALSAEQAGAAARALEITVEYTKTRVQFGRPIGSFQALQHRMADLHVLVQAARSVAFAAAEAAALGAPDLPLRAATAKAYCSEALQQVSAEMLQLHGAIAMTWEHEAHRYFKRAHGDAQLLGRPAEHIERIAAAVVDGSLAPPV
jgi:alkylation response protein AidB-like acyl-CoA dehydrogenase